MSAYTVTFIAGYKPVLIRVFHAESIGKAFDAAVSWDEEQDCPTDYDSIQIQPSWILWQEEARSAA